VEDFPTWSPEGGRLAYESDQSGNSDIWVMEIKQGQSVNLTENHKGSDRCPSWSPDGKGFPITDGNYTDTNPQ